MQAIDSAGHGAQIEFDDAYVDVQGARTHYVHAGAGRPLVMIHGLVGSASNWRRNIGELARTASVYALDMVNMGKSDRVAGLDAGLAATADRVAAFMDALGLAEADIAAHSHGGAVALMLAVRHPERVRSLVLFAPANPFSALSDTLVRIYSSAPGRRLARLAPYLPRRVQLMALARMYGDPARVLKESLSGYVDGGRVPGTVEHVLAIVRGWHTDMAELRAALPRVGAVPTLLVWGDRDRAVSVASGPRLQRELPASELMVIPGGGHVVFEEMPEQVNGLMAAWLRRDHDAERHRYVPATPVRLGQPHAVHLAAQTALSANFRQTSHGV